MIFKNILLLAYEVETYKWLRFISINLVIFSKLVAWNTSKYSASVDVTDDFGQLDDYQRHAPWRWPALIKSLTNLGPC
jgi:hypothetical protein